MNKVLICVGLIFIAACTGASEAQNKTEIVVIGTVHVPTDNYSINDLVIILTRIKPDVILNEHPINWFNEKYSLLSMVDPDGKPSLEKDSIIRYMNEHKSVLIRPYDIAGRNEFYRENRCFEREDAYFNKLKELIKNNQLSELAMVIQELKKSFYAMKEAFSKEHPRIINSSACDSIIELVHENSDSSSLKLAEIVPNLRDFHDFLVLLNDFWHRRNQAMVDNILQYAKIFQGKRLVVITGFEHRYYLRKLLEKAATGNVVVLNEYWQYAEK